MQRIYLDNNATTPLDPEVLAYFREALAAYGNPSSMHGFGREAAEYVHEARAAAGRLINADPDDIIFTSGGTESNNTVLSIFANEGGADVSGGDGYAGGGRSGQFSGVGVGGSGGKGAIPFIGAGGGSGGKLRNEIVISAIEHPAILETAQYLAHRAGIKLHLAPVDAEGRVRPDALENLISENTALVSVMLANNETGVIQDLTAIARIAHAKGAFVHSDAVQALGKIPIDAAALGLDYLSASGHKIYAPKGVGFLWRRKGAPFTPYARGGHQEQGQRAGTINAPAIAAFGKACALAMAKLPEDSARLAGLRDRLRAGIEERIPNTRYNGCAAAALPNTLNLSFRAAEGESILLYLDLEGIAVSTGSACASGSLEPSHVLTACGLGAELAHGSIRFSLGRMTTAEEIEIVIEKLPPVIARLRAMSTLRT
ncbi:MAG: aminotransferase class V-fold PLP-dependent enzyme [Spirochaetota bacterium]|jgi:cysteine desulfurase|nr:aminotransferase class V-fold PLP-dependent enzyme [Spirochaetota bacterium]